jgi:hypothetical protein
MSKSLEHLTKEDLQRRNAFTISYGIVYCNFFHPAKRNLKHIFTKRLT